MDYFACFCALRYCPNFHVMNCESFYSWNVKYPLPFFDVIGGLPENRRTARIQPKKGEWRQWDSKGQTGPCGDRKEYPSSERTNYSVETEYPWNQ